MSLTPKQTEVFQFIQNCLKKQSHFPSLSDIAYEFSVSRVTAKRHVDALIEKKHIKKNQNRSDYFILNDPSLSSSHTGIGAGAFEVVASIAAGAPDYGGDHSPDFLTIDPSFFGHGQQKALVVSGESMLGDQICDGDLAIIQLQSGIKGHEIAAIRIEGEGLTLKRIVSRKDGIDLIPSNPRFKIRRYAHESVEVLGKLIGIIRRH